MRNRHWIYVSKSGKMFPINPLRKFGPASSIAFAKQLNNAESKGQKCPSLSFAFHGFDAYPWICFLVTKKSVCQPWWSQSWKCIFRQLVSVAWAKYVAESSFWAAWRSWIHITLMLNRVRRCACPLYPLPEPQNHTFCAYNRSFTPCRHREKNLLNRTPEIFDSLEIGIF